MRLKHVFQGSLLLGVLFIGIFGSPGCIGQEEQIPETVTTTQLTTVTPSPTVTTVTQPTTVTTTLDFQEFTLVDDSGHLLTFSAYPQSIVSLAPSNTEILFAVGAGALVVGVTDYCTYPYDFAAWVETGNMTSIGGYWNPPVEPIVALNPDLIVAAPGSGDAIPALRELGYQVLVLAPKDINGILQDINLVGKAAGHEADAAALISNMRTRIDRVTTKVAEAATQPTVYHEIWNDPLMSAGPGTWIDELISLAGGVNIFSDAETQWPVVSYESIIEKNPAILIFPTQHGLDTFWGDFDTIKARPGWDVLSAVQNDKLYTIDADIIARTGPRIVDALETIAQIIHPELFPSAQLMASMFAILSAGINIAKASTCAY